MSKHSTSALTMRDALYEAPGPKMRAKIRIGTAISLVAVAALAILVLQRFYVPGQLSVHYWYFFTHLTTWKFLLAGFEGTVKVALTAGAIARLHTQRPIASAVLVGTAASRFAVPPVPPELHPLTPPVHGALDETLPLTSVMDRAPALSLPLIVVHGGEHFFPGPLPPS